MSIELRSLAAVALCALLGSSCLPVETEPSDDAGAVGDISTPPDVPEDPVAGEDVKPPLDDEITSDVQNEDLTSPDPGMEADANPEIPEPECMKDADCNDGDPCTDDSCDPLAGCSHDDVGQKDGDGCCHPGDGFLEDDDCPEEVCNGQDDDNDGVTDEPPGEGVFSSPYSYQEGCAHHPLVVDLGGDGWLDILALENPGMEWGYYKLVKFTNKGPSTPNGNFSSYHGTSNLVRGSKGIVVADFDQDGKPDLAYPCENTYDPEYKCVTTALGKNGFKSQLPWYTGEFDTVAIDLAAGDLDQDGSPDLVTIDSATSVSTLLNDNDFYMSPYMDDNITAYDAGFTGGELEYIALGDLDGDDRPEAIVTSPVGFLNVLWNDGAGNFVDKTQYTWEAHVPHDIVLNDFDQDSHLDVLVLLSSGDGTFAFTVLMNLGNGVLVEDTQYPLPGPTMPTVVDLDVDGAPDVVVPGDEDGLELLILKNDGTGQFEPSDPVYLGGFLTEVQGPLAAGDMDNNGYPDLIATSYHEESEGWWADVEWGPFIRILYQNVLEGACFDDLEEKADVGQCKSGKTWCLGGGDTAFCHGQVLPNEEKCNDVDDDCDGEEDEVTKECFGGFSWELESGPCKKGYKTCTDGEWSKECFDDITPVNDFCDEVDNDCDGETDEPDCYTGPKGTLDVGACVSGIQDCEGPEPEVCAGEVVPQIEQCNNVDEDCDDYFDNDTPCAGWVQIPAGELWMGCEPDCPANAKPLHKVELGPFQMDRYEVTVAEYAACVESGTCTIPSDNLGGCNWGKEKYQQHPVNCLDWFQAKAYCEWKGWRLCSESEWERAARGSTNYSYPWGYPGDTDGKICEYAVVKAEVLLYSGAHSYWSWEEGCGTHHTYPFGSKSKGHSPFFALDMAGNVAEWVQDSYHPSYEGAPADGSAWESADAELRVHRGGSYEDKLEFCETWQRSSATPDFRKAAIGFRCCKSGLAPMP